MFSHLHCHTQWSTLDGFGGPEQWVGRLKELGMKSIAITDHGNVDSSIKMSQACREAGIKFIAGCEFYICEDMSKKNPQQDNRHICIYARNMEGWKNILRMLSQANIRGYHYKPRIDARCLLGHLEGTIISTACVASFVRTRWGNKLLAQLAKVHKDHLFLEIMPHDFDDQRKWNKEVMKIARSYSLPVIATIDAHYPRAEDAHLQELCLAINSGSTWDDPHRFRFKQESFYLADDSEMLGMFQKFHPGLEKNVVKRSLKNTQVLVDLCEDFCLNKIQPDLPLAPNVPIEKLKEEGKNEDDYFRYLVRAGLHKKRSELCQPIKVYRDRIEEELNLLISKKFSRYFLMVIDILDFCRENGIYVGPGRGSVGGCLVAWLTGITQVDPLKYDLLFSRFQDEAREDLPDIDLDFEQDRREEVVEYIRSVYGQSNVAQITTFLTMKGKMALQDVGRVFKVPRNEIVEVTKFFTDDDFDIETFENSTVPEVKSFYKNHQKVVQLALAIKDTIRGYGKHAAGVCISNHNLSDGINGNLAKRQGILVSNWDKDEGEYMGLMKLDVLGLTALSRIRVCCEMIKKNHIVDVDLQKIDLEDPKALATINRGDCVGIFQLGTPGLTRYCQDLGITAFKDVYNATALFRPGTLGSGMAMEFVKRKRGEKYRPIHAKVTPFTKDTEGIILYQEQCMFLFKELAGFDWGKCNKVRKVIAKSKGQEALEVFKKDFLKGCIEVSKMTEEGAEKVWDSIVDFSKYAFNKCLSPDTLVITKEGLSISIEDVPIGTLIDTPDGFCKIKNKHHNGRKEVFSFLFTNGLKIKCTFDHKFTCSDNKKRPLRKIVAEDLAIISKKGNCRVSSWERFGIIETMDLEMDNESHTFFANGLSTSNSHSVEYSIVSMWDAWLKTYYPGEFYASCLSYLSEDKRIEIIEEAADRGIGVVLPKYELSEARYWSYSPKENVLVMPFVEIVGIGEKVAEDIEKSCRAKRKTFFGSKANLSSIPVSAKASLVKIHADDIKWIPNGKERRALKDCFKYNLNKILTDKD